MNLFKSLAVVGATYVASAVTQTFTNTTDDSCTFTWTAPMVGDTLYWKIDAEASSSTTTFGFIYAVAVSFK